MNNSKQKIFLFTDGSVNPKNRKGFGAYLLIDKSEFSSSLLEKKIKIKKFDNTSSIKLELETLLWALSDVNLKNFKIVVYTDCQNIIGLKGRRDRFEKNNYMTSKGRQIKNEIDEIFNLVDRATRKALRKTT